MIDIRLGFSKTDRAAYISHLDCNRLFQRAFKRSGLPVWYTQGFNPHVYLTFPLPLSLGTESLCETVDFRLTEETPMGQVLDRLNEVLPEGVRALWAAPPVYSADKIASAQYEIRLYPKDSLPDALASARQTLEKPQLLVEKKTKKGMKQVDLKQHLSDVTLTQEGDCILLVLTLPAGSRLNINPSLVAGALNPPATGPFRFFTIRRTAILTDSGEMFR